MTSPLHDALIMIKESQVDYSELFTDIKDYVSHSTGANVTQKFVLGIISQMHEFNQYDSRLAGISSVVSDNPENQVAASKEKDITNRIAVRNALVDMGYITKKPNGLYAPANPQALSGLRAFLSKDIHSTTNKDFSTLSKDKQRSEFSAIGFQENQEWYDALPPAQKGYIDGLKQLSAEGWTKLKRVIDLKDGKQNYVKELKDYISDGSLPVESLQTMNIIKNGTLISSTIDDLRNFLSTLSGPRIMSNLGKDALYAFKKITHDTALQKNNILKVMNDATTLEGTAIRLYNKIAVSLKGKIDDKSFKLAMKQSGLYSDDNKPTNVGKKVIALYVRLKGKEIPEQMIAQAVEAIKNYNSPGIKADRSNKKAITRSATVKNLTDI